jgi:hypothetical protein
MLWLMKIIFLLSEALTELVGTALKHALFQSFTSRSYSWPTLDCNMCSVVLLSQCHVVCIYTR